jgi:hypothetical protein
MGAGNGSFPDARYRLVPSFFSGWRRRVSPSLLMNDARPSWVIPRLIAEALDLATVCWLRRTPKRRRGVWPSWWISSYLSDETRRVPRHLPDAGRPHRPVRYCDNGGVIRGKATHVEHLGDRIRTGIGLTVAMQAMNSLDQLQPVEGMGPRAAPRRPLGWAPVLDLEWERRPKLHVCKRSEATLMALRHRPPRRDGPGPERPNTGSLLF